MRRSRSRPSSRRPRRHALPRPPDMTSPDVAQPCPSLETLAAFADAALPAPERAAVVSHLAHCPRCRDLVSSVVAATAEESPAEAGGRVLRFRGWGLRLGALAAA